MQLSPPLWTVVPDKALSLSLSLCLSLSLSLADAFCSKQTLTHRVVFGAGRGELKQN